MEEIRIYLISDNRPEWVDPTINKLIEESGLNVEYIPIGTKFVNKEFLEGELKGSRAVVGINPTFKSKFILNTDFDETGLKIFINKLFNL